MNLLLCLLCWLVPFLCFAQSLDLQIIGSSGNFSLNSNGTSLSSTTGELNTATVNSSTAILTQGFQQTIMVQVLATKQNHDSWNITVFRNPSSSKSNIQSHKQTAFKAELFDATGQLISTYQWQGGGYSIDLQKLASGTYLMRVSDQDDAATFKIQKTH